MIAFNYSCKVPFWQLHCRSMAILPNNIVDLIRAEKRLDFRPQWDSSSDPRNFVLTTPLTINEETVGGFELRARVSKQFVNRDAMLQLEFAATARSRIELYRCEWRPFGVHTNKAWGPPGFELASFRQQSHEHSFNDNWVESEERMRTGGSLPGARPINPDPTTLSEFVAFCGRCFRITNIDLLEIPQRNADFFWTPDNG